MEWWLNVFFLVNGAWVPGHEFDGWAARPFPTESMCLERKTFAENECRKAPLEYPASWRCSPEGPLLEVPEDLQGRMC